VRENLDACAACRGRLEAERGIREEEASIIGLAAPAVTVPSFEELRAYVRANTPRRRPVSVRIYRLGWAASVVLALGTGWMLRGGQVPVTSPAGLRLQQAPAREAPASFDAAESDVAELERSVEPVPTATAGRVTQEAPVPLAPAPEAARQTARREVAAVAPTDGGSQTLVATPTEPVDVPTMLDVVDLYVVAALPVGARLAEEVVQDAAGGVGSEPVLAATEPLAQRENPTATDGAAAGAVVESERRSVSSDLVTSANALPPPVGLTTRGRSIEFGDARDDVAGDEDSYSLVVPGLAVIDVLNRGSGVRTEGQVALQRLESGDTLEVIHLPPELDPSVLEDPRPGNTELVVQRAAGWIVMRAPLSEEVLLELLERLLAEW
jgi:hypothetical protein